MQHYKKSVDCARHRIFYSLMSDYLKPFDLTDRSGCSFELLPRIYSEDFTSITLSGDISKKWSIGFLKLPLQYYLSENKPVASEYNKSDRQKNMGSLLEMASIFVHILEITLNTALIWVKQKFSIS